MNIDEYLDMLDDLVESAWSLPLTGKCAVNSDKIREVIEDIRLNIPTEIKQAKAIVADRKEIISKAKMEAEHMIRVAEEQARTLVSQEEVFKIAQEKSADMLEKAQTKAREMRRAATDFSSAILQKTEEGLIASVNEIRQARVSLKKPLKSGD